MKPRDNDATMGVASPDVKRIATASTEDRGTPNSNNGSDDTVVIDAPDDYVDPSSHDVLLSDLTSEKLHGEVGKSLQVDYLSVVPTEDESQLLQQKTFCGTKYGHNSRFMVNLPCRRCSERNHIKSPKEPLLFHNIIFLVDTGSPYSHLCLEAMEALLGGNGCNPVPPMLNVELSSGLQLQFHLSPSSGHFGDVNVLGGIAFFQAVDIISRRRTTGFTITFD